MRSWAANSSYHKPPRCSQDVLPWSTVHPTRPQVDCSVFTTCARDQVPRSRYLVLVYVLGYLHLCVLPTRSFVGAYYAAQVGISLKAVSTPNRAFLAALLTSLENLRSSVGSSDAITVESAATAYVENFALKVFASADNEDRSGVASRKTAKKFLAASTFFDVLNVFEDHGAWEAVSSPMSFSFLMKLISLSLSLARRIRFSISPACGENALC